LKGFLGPQESLLPASAAWNYHDCGGCDKQFLRIIIIIIILLCLHRNSYSKTPGEKNCRLRKQNLDFTTFYYSFGFYMITNHYNSRRMKTWHNYPTLEHCIVHTTHHCTSLQKPTKQATRVSLLKYKSQVTGTCKIIFTIWYMQAHLHDFVKSFFNNNLSI
jgi:hypothetical protein